MKNLTFNELPEAISRLSEQLNNLEKLLLEKQEQPINEPEQLLNVQGAAKFLGLTVPTIYSKVSKNELPVMKRGKRLYFSSIELLEYIKSGRKKSNAEIEAEAERHLLNTKKGLL